MNEVPRLEAFSQSPAEHTTASKPELSPYQIGRMAVLVMLAIVLSAWLIDRPVADFAHEVTRPYEWWFNRLTHIVDPLPVLAGLVCLVYVAMALCGVYPGPRGRLALRLSLALIVAIFIKNGIKGAAGRSWPETWAEDNISYIRDGIYGFFPWRGFNGTRAFQAFPSGHLTAICSTAMGVALAFPRFRWLVPIPVALVAIGMIGANYHWFGDLIGGAALGSAVALAAHRMGLALEKAIAKGERRG